MGRRGSVLLHVLVTSALVALIAASLMRLAMLRYQVEHRTINVNAERRYDEAALGMLVSTWNSNNNYCSNAGVYTCSGGAAGTAAPLTNCACTCTTASSGYPPSIVIPGGAPPCQLSLTSTNLP
jgi:hypothetical protein